MSSFQGIARAALLGVVTETALAQQAISPLDFNIVSSTPMRWAADAIAHRRFDSRRDLGDALGSYSALEMMFFSQSRHGFTECIRSCNEKGPETFDTVLRAWANDLERCELRLERTEGSFSVVAENDPSLGLTFDAKTGVLLKSTTGNGTKVWNDIIAIYEKNSPLIDRDDSPASKSPLLRAWLDSQKISAPKLTSLGARSFDNGLEFRALSDGTLNIRLPDEAVFVRKAGSDLQHGVINVGRNSRPAHVSQRGDLFELYSVDGDDVYRLSAKTGIVSHWWRQSGGTENYMVFSGNGAAAEKNPYGPEIIFKDKLAPKGSVTTPDGTTISREMDGSITIQTSYQKHSDSWTLDSKLKFHHSRDSKNFTPWVSHTDTLGTSTHYRFSNGAEITFNAGTRGFISTYPGPISLSVPTDGGLKYNVWFDPGQKDIFYFISDRHFGSGFLPSLYVRPGS